MAKSPSARTSTLQFDGAHIATPSTGEMSLSSTNDSTGISFMCPWGATLQRAYIYNRSTMSTAQTVTLKIGTAVTASKFYFNSAFSLSLASTMQILDSPATASGAWISSAITPGDALLVTVVAASGQQGGIVAATLVLNPNI